MNASSTTPSSSSDASVTSAMTSTATTTASASTSTSTSTNINAKRAADTSLPSDATTSAPKKRKLRKGAKRSKAERLARRTPPTDATQASLDELEALLDDPQSRTSNEWDAAQLLALRIGSLAAKELVVSKVLWVKEAPRAAAHYAKRLELLEASVLKVLTTASSLLAHDSRTNKESASEDAESSAAAADHCCNGEANLLVAKFLSDVSTAVVTNQVRLETFLWPWLHEQALAKSAADTREKASKESDAGADKTEHARAAARNHAMQAHAAAIRLVLLPPQHLSSSSSDATAKSAHAGEYEELQRLLVNKCIVEGAFLHFVATFAHAFAPTVNHALTNAALPAVEVPAAVDAQVVETEQQQRASVADRIERLLRLMWPDARVMVFGSSATGMLHFDEALACSDDLDLCVLLPSSAAFQQETAPLVVEMREHLSVYLPQCTDLLAIEGARIPIVHFTDPVSGLRCDVCVNNVAALWNTRLTRRLLRQAPSGEWVTYACALSRWLKRWRSAKRSLFGRGISSYGLQLLVFYFLQQRRVLPTLRLSDDTCAAAIAECRETLERFDVDAVDRALATAEVPLADPHDCRPPSFAHLLLDFFRFYALEFDYEGAVVSLHGGTVTKDAKQWTRKTWKAALSIEDPIERTRDLGTLFNRKSLAKFRTAVVHAVALLSDPTQRDTETALLRCMPYDLPSEPSVSESHSE